MQQVDYEQLINNILTRPLYIYCCFGALLKFMSYWDTNISLKVFHHIFINANTTILHIWKQNYLRIYYALGSAMGNHACTVLFIPLRAWIGSRYFLTILQMRKLILRWNNVPEATYLVSGRVGILITFVWLQGLCYFYYSILSIIKLYRPKLYPQKSYVS